MDYVKNKIQLGVQWRQSGAMESLLPSQSWFFSFSRCHIFYPFVVTFLVEEPDLWLSTKLERILNLCSWIDCYRCVFFVNQSIRMQTVYKVLTEHGEDVNSQLFVLFKCKVCNRRSWATSQDGEGREWCQDKFSCNTVCTGSLEAERKQKKQREREKERERVGRKEVFVSRVSTILGFILKVETYSRWSTKS